MDKFAVLYLPRQDSLVALDTVTIEQLAGMEVILGEGKLIVFHVVFNPIDQRWQLMPEDHLSINREFFSMYGLTLAVYEHEGTVFCAVRHKGGGISLERLDLDGEDIGVQEMSAGNVTSVNMLSIKGPASTFLIPVFKERDDKIGAILYNSSLE